MRFVQRLLKIFIPLVVVGGAAFIAWDMIQQREPPKRRARAPSVLEVEVIEARLGTYQVTARTQGTVQPRTESTLIPEVSGRVIEMSPKLRAGEFFEAGDTLLRIDPREYEAAVAIAKAELTQAQARLAEEQARGAQAKRDWRRLGERGKPDALVLRLPQLSSARAAVNSAKARLVQRELQLERTTLVAPYAGRVLEKNVDVGQFVNTGNVLAQIYAVDYVEIRLPLSDAQLQYIDVPEIYRRDDGQTREPGPAVELFTEIGSTRHSWRGRLVRAEGSIDTRTRQLYVIAQVDDPFATSVAGGRPLKIGQFVQAEIEGQTLSDVYVIPRGTLRAGDRVLVVDDKNQLGSQPVAVVWTDQASAVVSAGLSTGDRVVITAIGEGLDGTPVLVRQEAVAKRAPAEEHSAANRAN